MPPPLKFPRFVSKSQLYKVWANTVVLNKEKIKNKTALNFLAMIELVDREVFLICNKFNPAPAYNLLNNLWIGLYGGFFKYYNYNAKNNIIYNT